MPTFDQLSRRVIVEANVADLGITPEFAFEVWLKSRYRQIIETTSIGNLACHVRSRLLTVAPYTTGTITVVKGSTAVVGSGTTFTSAMVGRQLKVSGVTGWYNIASVTDATNLDLEIGYGGNNAAGASYFIAQPVYALADAVKWIIDVHVVGSDPMAQHSQSTFADEVPDRPAEPAEPTSWAPILGSAVNRSIELYPAPNAVYLVSVGGYANIAAPALSGSPLFDIDERAIMEGAISDALMYRVSKDNAVDAQTKQLWIAAAQQHEERFSSLRNIVQRRDAAWV